jgi:hypothetical protein
LIIVGEGDQVSYRPAQSRVTSRTEPAVRLVRVANPSTGVLGSNRRHDLCRLVDRSVINDDDLEAIWWEILS